MRENLMNRMINLYGFESPITIEFCRLCERWADTEENNKSLKLLVESHEADPQWFDEEE